jgi:hypothetical protein
MKHLAVGLDDDLHLRHERISSREDACKLLYISDIHLRPSRSDKLCRQVHAVAQRGQPHAFLLGGDLADRSTELDKLRDLIVALRRNAPVFAIGGNHDRRVGISRVRQAIESGGGKWIQDDSVRLSHLDRVIAISGPDASRLPEAHYHVMCAHYPSIWTTAKRRGFNLVLAGHLHGCQIVAFEFRNRLFPGAFFYPCCFLTAKSGAAQLIVSRGVSDLVPIRWRCPREVVLCHV